MNNYNNLLKLRIKSLRNAHKFSQMQIANKLNWNKDKYVNVEKPIEKGGIKITGEHLRDLCIAYELDSGDYFLFGKVLERKQPEFYFDRK